MFLNKHEVMISNKTRERLDQGRLKIWTEHSTLILLISKSFEVEPPKFQHFYNYKRNEFSPNLEGVA